MTESALIVDVVELRRRSGSRRSIEGDIQRGDLDAGERSVVDGRLAFTGHAEAMTDGVSVAGSVSGTWRAPCRRCLDDVDGDLIIEVHEVFEANPTEGETWPIEDERIDLTPALRELALLALPIAPLCRDDCAGPEPDRFPTGTLEEPDTRRDDRWAALDELSFDE